MTPMETLINMLTPKRIRVAIIFEMTLDPVDGGFNKPKWCEDWIRNHTDNFGIPSYYNPSVISVTSEVLS